ncbi:thiol-disulfide oxidoreductase DCC family protein [Rhizobium oryzicola]|uniref:DUF393 domain-containing protein n=1 Tax=Rhizobium oryzicola TaxID=1232668 RepID=A0ABT8T2H7_9HYPH|nr:DUF393 domain-containing protein [Rhizobium oryzicola]MDO1584750.1 DUF393 domain-containing protein [Rhizobium oryzicola]
MGEQPRVTVWYDSQCPLCAREIAWLRRLDRHSAIHFIDACDPKAGCPIDRQEILSRFHAMENGRLISGAAAFAAMWRTIPSLKVLGMLAGWPPLTPIFEAAYLAFLRIRPRLQAWMHKAGKG